MKPNPIRSGQSNAFANDSFARRLPNTIRQVQDSNSYPPIFMQDLDQLHDALVGNQLISLPKLPAPDADWWLADFEAHQRARWQDTEWFFAETYFFREINEAVRYWQTQQDPYRPIKAEELASDALQTLLEEALSVEGNREESLSQLLELALWGNRMDLSLPEAMAHGTAVHHDDLLVDDRDVAIERLLSVDGTVHLITDNFGSELAMDLVLVDKLLSLHIPVMMHVKMHPTYVSDGTVADVHWMLADFSKRNSQVSAFSKRLSDAMEKGFLRLAPDFFWNSCHFLNRIPPRLFNLFEDARLLILKGDANYRRATFDTIYPVDTPFSQVVDYLPAPLLALRTLKSDPIFGVSQDIADALDGIDRLWRVNGKRGVIQITKI